MIRSFGIRSSYSFSTYSLRLLKANKLPPRPTVLDSEIQEVFIKGGGNGGQKINKTNSKVQLKHIPTGIVVSCQFSRSREDNRKRAREILALKVEEQTVPEGTSRTSVVDEFYKKKVANMKKKAKKKYKNLDELKVSKKEKLEAEKQKLLESVALLSITKDERELKD